MFNGLESAVYYVDDLKAATSWYSETLGLKPHHDTPYYVGFTVGGDELGLHPAGNDPRRPGTEGQTAYWSVNNIEETVAHLIKSGATEYHKVTAVGEGIKIASVLDPFGNPLGVIQNSNSPNQG